MDNASTFCYTMGVAFHTENSAKPGFRTHRQPTCFKGRIARRSGKFQRTVNLPTGVDTDAAEAKFEDGILKIALPKSEEAKPKQIPIKAKS